ncbi:MAG: DNA gyrase inhibitor YacG [Candidatus Aureabacteria bacterium]|nr:DNA gyrase inhibitor YacG [Candidatus Auribacterota bacterium]
MTEPIKQFSCPRCGNKVEKSLKFFPFCSHHCKYSDLYGWLEGTYRISTHLSDDSHTAEKKPEEK